MIVVVVVVVAGSVFVVVVFAVVLDVVAAIGISVDDPEVGVNNKPVKHNNLIVSSDGVLFHVWPSVIVARTYGDRVVHHDIKIEQIRWSHAKRFLIHYQVKQMFSTAMCIVTISPTRCS